MASVVERSDQYANFLVAPLPAGQGVCQVCHGPANQGFRTCWRCGRAAQQLGTGAADAVVPISLAPKHGQYANELWRYKNTQGHQRQYFQTGLTAVLWRFLALHEACVAEHCTVPGFDVVTIVPSTSGRSVHPLRDMVAEISGVTRRRYRDLLTPTQNAQALGREASPARYSSGALENGEAVLLIDDTWTTGGHAQSAAAALKAAGAGRVAVVVLGRHLNGTYGDTAAHIEQARMRRYDWKVCVLRDGPHG
ncbi:hypothetical protein [Streptomyces sp. NRRL F-5135]|uniref:hypothetical protein n=1 Tax=Streptomyces sp. NRRL F-5135 TaxID=1463858 RepID=UPI0004CB4EB4|nr:hypothetical protein [Streptomyces sp. NRRL F-5135]